MNIPKNTQARIERFLWGHMTENEATVFEKEVAENSELKVWVDQIRIEHEAAKLMLTKDLRATLNNRKKEKDKVAQAKTLLKKDNEPKVISMKNRRSWVSRLSAAAGVLIVIGFGFLFLTADSNSDLGDKYFNETSFDKRSTDGSVPEYLKETVSQIEENKFDAALNSLNSLTGNKETDLVKKLTGEVNFRKGNFKEAATIFEDVIKNTTSSNVRKEAEMNLLMTYLADNRMEDFERLKDKILADGDRARKNKIDELTKDMNSFFRLFARD